jgi:2-oxo-4-hydroxy-4-carboxy-5-ureidoimidazoline decarboxylase
MAVPSLNELNLLDASKAREVLLRCCGSQRWAHMVSAKRPFMDRDELYRSAHEIWSKLDHADWLDAFAAHPRIGDLDALRKKFPNASWCSAEQGGVAGAVASVLHALADANRRYAERFGYIFIVCATGKSAEEMLQILQQRLHNEPEQELLVAAAEQEKITRLRLEKLIEAG